MATTIRTDFIGGPCDGQTKQVSRDQLATGAVVCGGAQYVIQGVTPTRYRATWGKLAAEQSRDQTAIGHAEFNGAWGRLMRTLTFTVPAELKRQRAALRRIRRAVR